MAVWEKDKFDFDHLSDLMVSLPALGGCLYRVSKYPQHNPMADVGKVFCKVQVISEG